MPVRFYVVSFIRAIHRELSPLGNNVCPNVRASSIRWLRQLATGLRSGQNISHKGKLFTILKAEHRKGTARQTGHVQLELRDLRTHLKCAERLRPVEDVEIAYLKSDKYQMLYRDGEEVVCMHPESYEQWTVHDSIFGEQKMYLSSGMEVTVESYENEPLIGSVPVLAEMTTKSISSEARDGMRMVEMENGLKLKLPAFIGENEKISFNTKEHNFVKRLHKPS